MNISTVFTYFGTARGGSVRLRKDGRWEGRHIVGYDDKGLPVTKNVLAKTKSECAAKLTRLRETLKEPAPNQPKPGILLADWLDLWYRGYKKPNLRPNTQMSYERRIYQHIIPALGQIRLDKLTTGDIQKFYTNLKKNGRLIRTELYGAGLSDQTVYAGRAGRCTQIQPRGISNPCQNLPRALRQAQSPSAAVKPSSTAS